MHQKEQRDVASLDFPPISSRTFTFAQAPADWCQKGAGISITSLQCNEGEQSICAYKNKVTPATSIHHFHSNIHINFTSESVSLFTSPRKTDLSAFILPRPAFPRHGFFFFFFPLLICPQSHTPSGFLVMRNCRKFAQFFHYLRLQVSSCIVLCLVEGSIENLLCYSLFHGL